MKLIFGLGGALIWFLISSCTTGRQSMRRSSDQYCDPVVVYQYDNAHRPMPTEQALRQLNATLTSRYSQHDLLLANAVGILPDLIQLNQSGSDSSMQAQLTHLRKRQQMLDRLLLAVAQIDGLAAELDCAGEQADQIAGYLDGQDSRRVRRLTILSVVLGAATTVATTLLQTDGVNKAVGIGGGIVSAGFGGLAAFSSDRTVDFRHPRNLLADIWTQPAQSRYYPPMIWYILNEKRFSNEGVYSISHNIRQRWQQYVVDEKATRQVALYFGEGGAYQADDLHNRATMLNQLQSSIRSIHQDLQSLLLALSR